MLLNLIDERARRARRRAAATIAISGRAASSHDGAADADDVDRRARRATTSMLEVATTAPAWSARPAARSSSRSSRRSRPATASASPRCSASCARTAAACGCAPRRGEGARFQVLWPSAVTPRRRTRSPAAALRRTVLVIDDEDLVRDVVARMVEDLGYAALTAPDGPAGLAIVEREPVDAVLVDLTMPRMSGAEVITRCARAAPSLPVVAVLGLRPRPRRRGPRRRLPAQAVPDRALERTLAKLLPDYEVCSAALRAARMACVCCPRDRDRARHIKVLLVEDDDAARAADRALPREPRRARDRRARSASKARPRRCAASTTASCSISCCPGRDGIEVTSRAARAHRRADRDGHRARRGGRSRARPRGRRRRLRHQAVLAARAARPDPRARCAACAARPARRSRRSRSAGSCSIRRR